MGANYFFEDASDENESKKSMRIGSAFILEPVLWLMPEGLTDLKIFEKMFFIDFVGG
jgi:hypothetical protein